MNFPKTLTLKLNATDLEGKYIDITDCPVARAIKRRNGLKNIPFLVGNRDVDFQLSPNNRSVSASYEILNWGARIFEKLKSDGIFEHTVKLIRVK